MGTAAGMFAHAVRFVRFETIGGAMRFSKTESSKREGTVSVTPSQSLAIRFASVMLAAVLAAEAEGDRNLSTQVTATASTAAEGGGVSMRKGM